MAVGKKFLIVIKCVKKRRAMIKILKEDLVAGEVFGAEVTKPA